MDMTDMGQATEAAEAPLKIALFSGNFNYLVDGAARALNRLAKHLVDRGHQVTVFSPTREEAAFPIVCPVVSVPSIPLPGRGEYLLGRGLPSAVRAQLDAFDPDLIHISAPDLLGWAALRYAEKHKLPSVASFHTRYDTYSQYYNAAWLESLIQKWLRFIHRKCDRVLAPTDETEAWLVDNDMARSIGRWARGVDRDLYTPQNRSDAWRAEHGFKPDDMVLLFVGRLVAEKGLKQYARVIDLLRARGIIPKVLVVGHGPERDSFEADIPDAVFAGFLDGADLATAYACADILFNPSVTEAFPNVILEAMASGLATVCADTIGATTVVEPDTTGYLITPTDDTGYADALERLVKDPARVKAMGSAGREAAARFSWPVILDEVITNYRDVIAEHAP